MNLIKSKLKEYYRNTPPMPNPDGLNQTVMKARERSYEPADKPAYNEISFWQFLVSQINFIRKRVWLFQLLVITVSGTVLFFLPDDANIIAIISAAAPLIALTNVFELTRSYAYKMAEIELSTRYSFKQLMIARLAVLGVADIVCLTIMIAALDTRIAAETYAVVLYALVPFMLTCIGCLLVLNRNKRRESNYYCGIIGLFIIACVGFISAQYPQIYELWAVWVWMLVFISALCGMVYEINHILKSCGRLHNGINY